MNLPARRAIQPYLARLRFPLQVYDLRHLLLVDWTDAGANPVTLYQGRGKAIGSNLTEEKNPWYWTYWRDTIYRIHESQIEEILVVYPPETEFRVMQDHPTRWAD